MPAGSLAVSLSSDIRGTEPGVNRDANTDAVMMHVFEGLVAYREDGSPGPLLADRIEVSDDGLTYRFTLRRGVRFHNGAIMTSADVIWTWRRYLDPETGWLCLPDFDGTKGVKILWVKADGPGAVVFRLSRAQPLFLSQMASVQCGGAPILHRSSVNADGSWRAPVFTGPYRIAHWQRGEYIDLAAFRDYSSRAGPRDGYTGGKHAQAPMVRWMVIRDSAARLAALIKGQIDVMPEANSAELRRIARYPSLKLDSAPSGVVNAILIRPTGPLADVRVRRALMLSIDRRAVVNLATGGTGAPNASLVPVGSSFHDAVQDEGRQVDVAQARHLLDQAGYRGEPITLSTNRRYSDMFNQALLVQAMAREAGINLRLQVSEWATQLDTYQTGKFELMSFSYSARSDPALTYESVIGDRSVSARKQWDDPAAIALLNQVNVASDPAQRQALFDQLHERMIRDVPIIVLFNLADNNALRRNVEGYKSWSISRARLWGVHKRKEMKP